MNLDATERAYLAGFFEGDGHVSIGKRQSKAHATPSHYLQVIISQSNRPFLEKWKRRVGMGSIHEAKGSKRSKKPHFRWHLSDRQAAQLLESMMPYLDIKKFQAQTALDFMKTKGTGGRRPTTPYVLKLREQYKQTLHDEKRRIGRNG